MVGSSLEVTISQRFWIVIHDAPLAMQLDLDDLGQDENVAPLSASLQCPEEAHPNVPVSMDLKHGYKSSQSAVSLLNSPGNGPWSQKVLYWRHTSHRSS